MLQTALDALARRDAAAALTAALAATAAEPDRADAQHALGLAYQLAGQADAAARALDRAIALAPSVAAYHLARAGVALGQRDLATADQALQATVEQDPNALGAYIMSAYLALGRGELAQAEQQFKRAQRVAPEHPLTRCIEGNLALARGQHGVAQGLLAAAAQAAPNEPMVLSSLALAYFAAGNHAFAEQALRRALEVQPEAANLRRLLVETLRRQGRTEDLPAALEAMLAAQPADWNAWAQLGESRLLLGQLEPACEAFARMLEAPALPVSHVNGMIGLLAQRGLAERAAALLDAQLEREPQREVLWQGRMATIENDPQALLAGCERWLAALPASPPALQARATLREQLGDLAGAEADADAALAGEPLLAGALMLKLRAELRRDPAALLPRIDALLPQVPGVDGQKVLRMFRGLALDRLGRYDEAAPNWVETRPITLPPPRPRGEVAPASALPPPRLLWGAPGSRVRQIVAALRAQSDAFLLDDRFGATTRVDGYGAPREDGQLATLEQWAEVLQQGGVDPARVIDWLPYYDPRIAAAMPGARLLAVLDDPRDLLLNWLAFGAAQAIAPAPDAAADWLADSLEAVTQRIEAGDPAVCRVGSEQLLADPDAVLERVRQFYGLGTPLPVAALTAAGQGLADTPIAFPPGHWRHYANALAAPFARLAPLAQRLGYPAG